MIKFILATLFICCTSLTFSQTVNIDGNAYLEGETSHDSIKVFFERLAPSTLFDSTYTNSIGYYSIVLQAGLYGITYSKDSFLSTYREEPLYSSGTISNTLVETIGLSGKLSDTLKSGTYKVSDSIMVAFGDTLVIEAGVELLFKQDLNFEVRGLLIAEGTETDSIRFSLYEGATSWHGIDITDSANNNSQLSYCIVEYSASSGIHIDEAGALFQNLNIRDNLNGTWEHFGIAHGGGIMSYLSDIRLVNSIVSGNDVVNSGSGGGIYAYKGILNIINCLITDNTLNGIMVNQADNLLLINNTIVNNDQSGIIVWPGTIGSILNCLVSSNSNTGIILGPLAIDSVAINHCNVWGNGVSDFSGSIWHGVLVTINANGDSCDAYFNIQEDPQFIDESRDNYKLKALSPCANAGNSDTSGLLLPLVDLGGGLRIIDSIIDIGAFESSCPDSGYVPPIVGFQIDSIVGKTAFLRDTSSSATSWYWTFGDGASSPLQNPQHTYSDSGSLMICLTVSDSCGSGSTCQTIYIEPCPAGYEPPITGFKIDSIVDRTVFLKDTSFDAISWNWTFGDGDSSPLQNPQHTYSDSGSFEICLTASNFCGSTSSCETVYIDLCPAAYKPPIAGFQIDSTVGKTVFLRDTSSSASSWHWTFGDGDSSTLQNPQHNFSSSGTFEICLTVSDSCGSASSCQTIVISGIEDPNSIVKITVYPNPNNGIFKINLQGHNWHYFTVELISVLTERVWQTEQNGSIIKVDVSNLAGGIYVCRVQAKNLSFRVDHKIVITR